MFPFFRPVSGLLNFTRTNIKRCYSIYVPTEELIQRRSNLLDRFQRLSRVSDSPLQHLVVLPAAEQQYMAFHVPYPFHQDSNFIYFTGLSEPNAVFVFVISTIPNSTTETDTFHCSSHLFIDSKSKQSEIWDGPSLGLTDVSTRSAIKDLHPRSQFQYFLQERISLPFQTFLWYGPLSVKEVVQQPVNRSVLKEVSNLNQEIDKMKVVIRNPCHIIDGIRLIKSSFEIKQLKKSATLTLQSLVCTLNMCEPDICEASLRNYIEYKLRTVGGHVSYPPVVAGGDRTNIIHYMKSDKIVKDGELVLIDVGCRTNGYTSDITRTWPVNGHFTSPQLILYEILSEVQKSCANAANPSCSLQYLHSLMLNQLRYHLINERIMPPDTSLHDVQKICPHHIGHYLGLDVHDTPTVPCSTPFAPGMVFCLEPGVYFRKELISLGFSKEFMNLGLRLEDDFVIADNGNAQILANGFPTGAREMEQIIGVDRIRTVQ